MKLKQAEWIVLIFTVIYVLGFLGYFTLIANREFLGYILTMMGLVAIVALAHRTAQFPTSILWALSLWGLAHMAGGGVPVNGSVLYNFVLLPLTGDGELRLLKYDQVVHLYGFAITAWMLWHLLRSQYPVLRRTRTIYVFSALASMGLGAVNEIVEFSAVMLVPNTNVGGYYNTALDLVFNAAGAITAMAVCAAIERARTQ